MNLGEVLEWLYDREINVEIESFWDGGYDVAIGDSINGYKAGATFHPDPRHGLPIAGMAAWLEAKARELYPIEETLPAGEVGETKEVVMNDGRDGAADAAEEAQGETGREPTFGERAVGLTFNPGGREDVDACKRGFAAEIDRMHDLRSNSDDPEQGRLASIAITELQGAQMWAVKALTWSS